MNSLVVKANDLVEGFINMTKTEYKLTTYLISKIKKDDKSFMVQKVSVKEFSDLIGINSNQYTQMKKIATNLVSNKISISRGKDFINLSWFSYTKYIDVEGMLEIRFNDSLKPYLLDINIPYTKYFLNNIKNLKSKYSMRLYELLKQYEKLKEREISINDLRLYLGIEKNEYTQYNDLKRRVLLKAQKELVKHTDISFDLIPIKVSRRVNSIKFIIKSNDKNIKNNNKLKVNDIEDDQLNVEDSKEPNLNNTLVTKFNTKYNANIAYKWIDRLVNNKGFECVEECIDEFKYYVSSANEVEKTFFDFTMKYGTEKAYTKTSSYKNNFKPVQATNYEQREYGDDFFNSLYANVTLVRDD